MVRKILSVLVRIAGALYCLEGILNLVILVVAESSFIGQMLQMDWRRLLTKMDWDTLRSVLALQGINFMLMLFPLFLLYAGYQLIRCNRKAIGSLAIITCYLFVLVLQGLSVLPLIVHSVFLVVLILLSRFIFLEEIRATPKIIS